ncbi:MULTISPECIES: MerR family transcriptional regulator [Bacillus]|jgi:DNA-binding transcriptional MerR regulator|uniref:MerR-family transcriptional regulator n=1 Tax=Bacillus cereus (strain G9842) TaxID=405531 RepID=B7IZQ5_BACC2|nr:MULTISPECIES: MerR family transcriptional regulator [Bacillus]MBS9805856.1 MerR family transcriptional regulator [Bacillus toyonensis]ACK98800.1 MerR-family transcriptional regulator [Bacillus cereus G9842]KUF34404.1 hypothetical protein AMR94_02060 [Bacillus sp. G3(2015)]MCU5511313.1 MerR family transcriptional regulator [Bacillus cereus]MDA1951633.1 MerR family transcriptional regulator [Bacillus cereus]
MNTLKVDYTMKQTARILGVHRDTLMYWETNHLIPIARRNPKNNYRIYTIEEIIKIANIRGIDVVNNEVIEKKYRQI